MGAKASSPATFSANNPFCVQSVAASNAATAPTVLCRGSTQAEALSTASAAHAMCQSFNAPGSGAYTCPDFTKFDGTAGPNLGALDVTGITAKSGSYPLAPVLSSSNQYINVGASGGKPVSLYPMTSAQQCKSSDSKITATQYQYGTLNFCNVKPTTAPSPPS